MCNLSEGIFENGRQEGIREGIQETNVKIVKRLLNAGQSEEQIRSTVLFDLPEEEFLDILQKAKQNIQ